jgi:hypothetical protein
MLRVLAELWFTPRRLMGREGTMAKRYELTERQREAIREL